MIICCGEALIDMLPRQLPDGSDVFLPVAGGAIFNTAIALGRLGADTGFVSGLSTDMFGDQLVEALRQSNVSTDFSVRHDHPTTLAFVKLSDGHAQYSFFDENSAGRMLSSEVVPALPGSVAALHFGAISLIPEPCGTAYETLLMQHAPDAIISLDPNIRPGFIADEKTHRERINRMAAKADIIKVSDEDLDWIADSGASAASDSGQKQIAEWLAGDTSVVIMTRGSEGATAYTSHGNTTIKSQKVTVVDTVGAGDTFNAGFLHGLSRAGLLNKKALASASPTDLESALDLANRVAAVTVSRAGANPPWAAELNL